jgi:hypothetical protein
MTGGILQLVARGYDDTYIIKEPEITYFKIVYRRHTNFSISPKILNFNESLNFGQIGRCRVKMLGDLLSKIYLAVEIPEIDVTNQFYTMKDLLSLLSLYEIEYDFIGDLNSQIGRYLFCDLLEKINLKITELVNLFKSESIIAQKQVYLAKLKKIGFSKNNCWYFPNENDFFNENFKHNEFSLKLLSLIKTGKPQFCWVKELLHYLTEYVEINIGGVTIDTHTSETLRCDTIINLDENKIKGYAKMIGNIPELYTYNSDIKPRKLLYLPLKFWFCNHFSESLPLVAMPHSFVDIIIKFRNFEDVSYSNYTKFIKPPKLNAYLIAHYIYVEEEERKRLCENKLEYLIENHEITHEKVFTNSDLVETKNIDSNDNLNKYNFSVDYKLNFNFVSKQIYWVIKPYKINDPINKFDWNFYDENNNRIIPMKDFVIKFNGRDREIYSKKYGFYSLWQPYKHYCSSLVNNMFMYNFALYPQQLQPSGTANFGKMSDCSIQLFLNNDFANLVENFKYKFRATCYSTNYNILRIFSGMAGLAFTK